MSFLDFYKRASVILFFTALFLSLSLSVEAQISANPASGCAPLIRVQFNGISGSTAILWDFKDGATAAILNPIHTFSAPGTYNVTYTATVAGKRVNQTIPIQVFGKPTPSFVATTLRGCKPLTVSFKDNSTGSGGSAIAGWEWSFGDGGTNFNNTSKPTYTYSLAGVFSVNLKVTDANGCDTSLKITNMIATSAPPMGFITTTPASISSCFDPLNIQFSGASSISNSTTGSTKLSYSWDFSNNTYTSDPNYSTVVAPPTVTYTNEGNYPINLIVTDNNNCSAKAATKNVSIVSPLASFSVNDTVCKTVAFTVSNPKGNSLFWDYGDGKTGTSATHTYLSSGSYNVKLTATSGNCSDDTIRTIFVEEVKADFNYTPSYFCNLPGSVLFKDLSVNANIYSWTFSKGSDPAANQFSIFPVSSIQQSPSVAITNLYTNQYAINKPVLLLNATLAITSAHGCKSTMSKTLIDTISLPTARFVPNTTIGCAPLKVDFLNSSLSKEQIINWRYEFGDGTVANVNTKGDTSHTYTTPGIYKPILIIKNSNGCVDTSYAITIYVGNPPVVDFSVSPTSVCLGQPVQFTNLIPSSDSVDTWHYATDGGVFMSSCSQDPNPKWSYKNSTGLQDVTLTACSHGCCSSLTKSGLVNVKGPLAKATVRMNCDTPHTYIFTANIQDADRWVMSFGDNDSVVTTSQTTFSHSYLTRGDYVAILTAYSSSTGCTPAKDTILIKVRNIRAGITSDVAICPNSTLSFSTPTSQDVEPKCNGGYIWLFGDGSGPTITSNSQVSHTYNNFGKITATLIVSDVNGCRDTAKQFIRVFEVTPKFTTKRLYICTSDTINFINQTLTDTTVSGYQWDFGDSTTGTSTSLQPNISHVYPKSSATSFTVKLTVNTAFGCSETFSKKIFVSKPSAIFKPLTDTTICAGDSVKFQPNVTLHKSYLWVFGDGIDSSKSVSPTHTYTSSGSHTVFLSITDSIGCYESDSIVSCVKVQDYPNIGFVSSADSTQQHCYPFVSFFADTSIATVFDSRKWDLGIGTQSANDKEVKTVYQLPGNYKATLIVNTTYGCRDSISKAFKVDGPLADFTVSDSVICKGATITLSIKDTLQMFAYHWDLGDGFDTSAVSPVTHRYNSHPPAGIVNAKMIFWGLDSTCIQIKSKQISIHQVIADFERNNELTQQDTIHCMGTADLFTENSIGANKWTWNFGDGIFSTTSGTQNHQYSSAGEYTVSLGIANNQNGCVDTIYKSMIIFPIPHTTATGGDTCAGKSFQLHATGGNKYIWRPRVSLNNDTIPDPVATPSVSTTYSVIVTDSNGCSQSNSAFMFIEQSPPKYTWDTTIITGMSIQLNAFARNTPSYRWTPNEALSCTTCYNPVANPSHDVKYMVTISDTSGCFAIESSFNVHVLPLPYIDVPTAFTPNGDGTNDIIYVGGWGIKRLIEFKIYNRWGELVFETDDIKQGWDGAFKGVPQNIETYVYQIKVETYIDKEPVTKKGYIKLFR